MAYIESNLFKIDFKILECDINEYKRGNPYNTTCSIKIYSNGFFGSTNMLVNYKDLILFSDNIEKMYNSLKGETFIKDFDFGSYLKVECDYIGKFVFSGILINETFQELKFVNTIDQTYLKQFIYDLMKELKCVFNN